MLSSVREGKEKGAFCLLPRGMKETDMWHGGKGSNGGHYGQAGIRLLLAVPCVQAPESDQLYAPPDIHPGRAVEHLMEQQSLVQ